MHGKDSKQQQKKCSMEMNKKSIFILTTYRTFLLLNSRKKLLRNKVFN